MRWITPVRLALIVLLTGCQSPTTSSHSTTATPAATYTVTYFGNSSSGGTVPVDTKTYSAEASVKVLDNTGSLVNGTTVTFTGWNTSSAGDGTYHVPKSTFSMGTADVSLYAVWAAPTITGISPTSGVPGTVVTVTGTGFSTILDNNLVGVVATGVGNPTTSTSTQMTFAVPDYASIGATTVAGETSVGSTIVGMSGNPAFAIVAPTITSISPVSGVPGTVVTVTGTGFRTATASDLVGLLVTGVGNPTTATSTQMTFTVPDYASTGATTVAGNVTYGASNQINFVGEPAFTVSAPTITGISPTSGPPGTVVTVTGTGFSTTLAKDLVGLLVTGVGNPTTATSTQMTFTIPNGTSTGVTTVEGNVTYGASNQINFVGEPTFTVN